jgi:hypothetical protein
MYFGTSINNSATIVAKANADIAAGEFLAAKFTSGKIAVCGTAGENSLGLIIPGQEGIKAGEDVDIQIKDIGLWKTGAAVSAGAELTTNASGKAITATAGAFILAIALEDAAAENAVIKVQVIKSGYKSGGVVAPLTLAGLTDVDITSIADGDAIVYDGTATKYVNKALSIDDLSDVAITTPADKEVLEYEAATTTWKNATNA